MGLCYAEDPAFDFRGGLFLRSEGRVEEAGERVVEIGALQPGGGGVGGLLISIPVRGGKPTHPQGGVDFREKRGPGRTLPSIKRPDVRPGSAGLAKVAQPGEPGVGGSRDLSLNVELENRLCRGTPAFGESKPARLPGSDQAVSMLTISYGSNLHVLLIRWPVSLEIVEKRTPIPRKSVLFKVGHRKREPMIDPDEKGAARADFLTEPLGQRPPRPEFSRAGGGKNFSGFAGAPRLKYSQPAKAGVGRGGSGIIDSDVTAKLWHGGTFALRVMKFRSDFSRPPRQKGISIEMVGKGPSREHTMFSFDLSSLDWEFRSVRPGGLWHKAQIPGCVHTDLLRAGQIPDPFYSTNELDLQWIEECDWDYRTTFSVPDAMECEGEIELCADGLDTVKCGTRLPGARFFCLG